MCIRDSYWCLSSTFVTSRANDMCLWCYVIYPRRLGSTSSRPIVSLFLNLISFSRQTPFILNMWPWYASFLSLIDASKLLATPAVSSTHSLVLLAVHDTLNTCLRHSFQKHWSFFRHISLKSNSLKRLKSVIIRKHYILKPSCSWISWAVCICGIKLKVHWFCKSDSYSEPVIG